MSSKFAFAQVASGASITNLSFDQITNILSAKFSNPGGALSGNPARLYVDGNATAILSTTTGADGSINFNLGSSLSIGSHTYIIQVDYTSGANSTLSVNSIPVTVSGAAPVTVAENVTTPNALTLTADRAATFAMTNANGTGASVGSSSGMINIPALSYKRDSVQQPFTLASFWNVPIGDAATYQQVAYKLNYNGSIAGNETWAIRSVDPVATGSAGANNSAYPIVQAPMFGVYYGTTSDPLVPLTFQGHPQDPTQSGSQPWATVFPEDTNPNSFYQGGTIHVRAPSSLIGMAYDKWAVLFLPDRQNYLEFEGLEVVKDSSGNVVSCSASYIACNNIYGRGFPGNPATPDEYDGIRAFGGSLLGGMIRISDIASGRINHAIAMQCSPGQQKYATSKTNQHQWPAYIQDGASLSLYKGVIPMGAMFAIPWSVDIETIGLKTASGKMLARAFQEYGGYNTDTATGTFVLAGTEAGMASSVGTDLATDLKAILNNLCYVTNNVSSAVAASSSGRPVAVGGGGASRIVGPRANTSADVPSPTLKITATSTTAIPGIGTAQVPITITPAPNSASIIFRSPSSFTVMENTRLGFHIYCNKPLASATLSGIDASKFEVGNYGVSGLWIRFASDGTRTGAESYSFNVNVTDTDGVTATQAVTGTQIAQSGGNNILTNANFASGDLSHWTAGNGAQDSGAVTFPSGGGVQLNLGGANPWYNDNVSNSSNNYFKTQIYKRIRVQPGGHVYIGQWSCAVGGNGKGLLEIDTGQGVTSLAYTGFSTGTTNGGFNFTTPANQPYVYLRLTLYSTTNTASDFAKFSNISIYQSS